MIPRYVGKQQALLQTGCIITAAFAIQAVCWRRSVLGYGAGRWRILYNDQAQTERLYSPCHLAHNNP